jgi:hypothetical protein
MCFAARQYQGDMFLVLVVVGVRGNTQKHEEKTKAHDIVDPSHGIINVTNMSCPKPCKKKMVHVCTCTYPHGGGNS